MAKKLRNSEDSAESTPKTPVLTRIKGAKFKREVKPGDIIRIHVTLDENIGNAWFFKGKILVRDKTAVKVTFGCALSDNRIEEIGSNG